MTTIKLYRVPSEFSDVRDHITLYNPHVDIYYEDIYELPEGYTEGETIVGERAIFDPDGKYCELQAAGLRGKTVLLCSVNGVRPMRIATSPVVANRIRERRQNAELTQQQLAATIGATQKQISAWESGQNEPGLKFLKAIAYALDCAIDDLV